MDCPPVFWITFSIKTSQTVTIFEIIKNFISEILKQLDMELKLFNIWYLKLIPGHIPDGHFPDGLFSEGHFPEGHFPDQTHPRRTLPRPDTSPTDTSPTRHIPDRHFPDQTNARQIFAWEETTLEIYMLYLEL